MGIYEPAEDSFLLQKHVRELTLGRVLDMGTGSGIQALTAIKNPNVHMVVAVDQDEEAVHVLQQKINQEKIRKLTVAQSDLFSQVSGKYNVILCNPPYLPQDRGIEDKAIYGGKKGWELAERFFREVSSYLYPDGKILFLFSSLTNQKKIEEIITKNMLMFEEIDHQKLAFETLYVYLIQKHPVRRELEKKAVEQISYFTKGKRGMVFTGVIDHSKFVKTHLVKHQNIQKVAIKVLQPDTEAQHALEKESYWLKQVNQRGIGPRLLFTGENFVAMEFIDGPFLTDWMAGVQAKQILAALGELLHQCYVLDQLGITKEEMHHPHKHVLMIHNLPVLVDFERCHESKTPQNVTQCVEFITRMRNELAAKGLSVKVDFLRALAKAYKKEPTLDLLTNMIQTLK